MTIIFNGEIYGFQALREKLEARGHRFKTQSDTEVIVHLYEDEGVACLRHLKGMFAFAVWDERAGTLFLARDRLGKKPLYYAVHQGMFLFASEVQALLAVPGLSTEIDELALDQYMTFGYIPAPRTIYRGVKKLEAGHYMSVKADGSWDGRTIQYWLPVQPALGVVEWEEARRELLERLRMATALRLVSDVPLGCFLSGGVDSSIVLSIMAELSPQPVKTFSIGFQDQDYSELKYARTIARHFAADHHEYVLEPDGIGILDNLVSHFGEPFADPSALPTWYLAQMTRNSVTVALTGDGGDELFAGYSWYNTGRMLEAASFVPRWLAQAASNLAAMPVPRTLKAMGKAAALLTRCPSERYAALRQVVSPAAKEVLYTSEYLSRTGQCALGWLAEQYDLLKIDDPLNRMMATDLATYMAEDLLVKVDRTSMAHSLECRSPLLDTDLVEWVLGLPSAYKLPARRMVFSWRGSGGKWLLREAVRERFPRGFLDRPKQGFEVPLERWFRTSLQPIIRDRVLHGSLTGLKLFNPTGIEHIVEEHFSGKRNHEALVWALLVLATWAGSQTA